MNIETEKPTTRKSADQKSAWQKKYGAKAGDLLLKYRAKIAAQAKQKARMSEGVVVALCIFATTIFSGCGNNTKDPVQMVKDGILEIDKSTTIGQAFDGYRFFKNTEWKVEKTDTGRTIVRCIGNIDFGILTIEDVADVSTRAAGKSERGTITPEAKASFEKSLAKIRRQMRGVMLIFQFVINKDNTFEVKNGDIIYLWTQEKNGVSSAPFDNMEVISQNLREIYENRMCSLVESLMISIIMNFGIE